MIYLISQVTFIFQTQIYCNMNFITSSSNFFTRFLCHFEINLRWLLLEDYFCSTQKMHIYVCKICLKQLGILLKCSGAFEKLLQPKTLLKIPKGAYYAAFYEFKTTRWTDSFDKQNPISQKCKSYEISSTDIYIGEGLEFIIHVFYWCIQLDHGIYTKCNKKHLTWLKLFLVIISALELKTNKRKKNIYH